MIALLVIGVLMIISTSSVLGYAQFNDSTYFIKRHLVYLSAGVIAMLFGVMFPYERYKKAALIGLVITALLTLATLIPGIGLKAGGASRWIALGPIQFQPVEFVKFFIVVFVAASIENKGDNIRYFLKGMAPILGVVLVVVGTLLVQPDLDNSILTMTVTLVMLYVSAANEIQLFIMGGVAVAGAIVSILTHPYQMSRVTTFFHPWADPLGKSYHIIQSMIAIGSGGMTGLGIGESRAKYFYLPLDYMDFIYSVVCEEGGLWLGSLVVILFCVLCYRGCLIAKRCKRPFGQFLAVGLTMFLVCQALINMGMVIGIFPVSGIPLTFISFGGSALVSSMFYCGVILGISRSGQA